MSAKRLPRSAASSRRLCRAWLWLFASLSAFGELACSADSASSLPQNPLLRSTSGVGATPPSAGASTSTPVAGASSVIAPAPSAPASAGSVGVARAAAGSASPPPLAAGQGVAAAGRAATVAGRAAAPIVPPAAPAAGTAAMPATPVETPAMSAGCGKTMYPPSARNMIDVMGMQREYIVKLPTNYDPNKPYKLVFAWHYLGGSAQGIATGFGGLGEYGRRLDNLRRT